MPGIVVRVKPPTGQAHLPLHSPALHRESRRLAVALRSLDGVARVENPLGGG
ncbi:MAG TPA: hypothetical protein VLK56_06165 [Solirubrobacterales bacterium]|nr:hypothetical protein [Solirubrobacterales bacterium]